eukprot:7490408-Pyramimonas_sp.AAC.1
MHTVRALHHTCALVSREAGVILRSPPKSLVQPVHHAVHRVPVSFLPLCTRLKCVHGRHVEVDRQRPALGHGGCVKATGKGIRESAVKGSIAVFHSGTVGHKQHQLCCHTLGSQGLGNIDVPTQCLSQPADRLTNHIQCGHEPLQCQDILRLALIPAVRDPANRSQRPRETVKPRARSKTRYRDWVTEQRDGIAAMNLDANEASSQGYLQLAGADWFARIHWATIIIISQYAHRVDLIVALCHRGVQCKSKLTQPLRPRCRHIRLKYTGSGTDDASVRVVHA